MAFALIITLLLLTIILSFWALIDISRSRFKNPNMRTLCLIGVLFFPVLGAIIYFQSKRSLVIKEPRKFQPKFN
jgi:dolichyl-phosphate-mannose--protein O-mannosyl transferase